MQNNNSLLIICIMAIFVIFIIILCFFIQSTIIYHLCMSISFIISSIWYISKTFLIYGYKYKIIKELTIADFKNDIKIEGTHVWYADNCTSGEELYNKKPSNTYIISLKNKKSYFFFQTFKNKINEFNDSDKIILKKLEKDIIFKDTNTILENEFS